MRTLAVVLAGGAVLYLLVAPLVLVAVLGAMLTAGVVDWSGEKSAAPSDPLLIGYRGNPKAAFGWEYETVLYPTDLGDAEAWLIPAPQPASLWAIWVHGIGGTRENGYRMVETLHQRGVPVLMIAYRNDKGAPKSPDNLYSFGLGEWRDLEAAVTFAVERGAVRVAILAESMGAGIAGQYLMRADNTDRIAGLALDAPALDFPAVIRAGGERYWVPLSDVITAAGLQLWTLFRRDLREAISLDAVAAFEGPVFVAHGRRDPLVPFAISERLAARRPDLLFWTTDADRHPMSFESDRDGYRRMLGQWLGDVQRAVSAVPPG